MESLISNQLKELPTMVGSILHTLEEQHGLLPAACFQEEGIIDGHGGHGGHSGAIVDDVLAALPLLGRNHILPKVGEIPSEIPAN